MTVTSLFTDMAGNIPFLSEDPEEPRKVELRVMER